MKEARLKRVDSECSTANIDFLLRGLNNKNHNELKPIVFYLHDPPPLPTQEVGQFIALSDTNAYNLSFFTTTFDKIALPLVFYLRIYFVLPSLGCYQNYCYAKYHSAESGSTDSVYAECGYGECRYRHVVTTNVIMLSDASFNC